jgi:heat shock protein HslJ
MTRARRGLVAATLATGLLLATAGPALAGDSGAPLRSPVGDWRTSTMGVKQTITFDDEGRVYGDSGCNRFTGGYTVKGDRITIGPLASTMMFCEGKMDAEQSFLTRLQDAESYKATKKELKIFTSEERMVFKAAPA